MARKPYPTDVTDEEWAFVDQGYTGEKPRQDAARNGIELSVVKLPQAKRGFVLLPRQWVGERSFACLMLSSLMEGLSLSS